MKAWSVWRCGKLALVSSVLAFLPGAVGPASGDLPLGTWTRLEKESSTPHLAVKGTECWYCIYNEEDDEHVFLRPSVINCEPGFAKGGDGDCRECNATKGGRSGDDCTTEWEPGPCPEKECGVRVAQVAAAISRADAETVKSLLKLYPHYMTYDASRSVIVVENCAVSGTKLLPVDEYVGVRLR